MNITKTGKRGTLFTFHELGIPTNIYVINGTEQVYIIDTYLGAAVMEEIDRWISENAPDKPIVVINTHSHWDHVWGNCFYRKATIIAHEKCRERMLRNWQNELERFSEYKMGEVEPFYPNLTFTDSISFENDGIHIFHSPGHTEDCITILDREDKVLYAGDNLERPIPYIMDKDLEQYIRTLEQYLDTEAGIIIGGHTACEDKALIRHNLEYVKKVMAGDTAQYEKGEYEDYHKSNMDWLASH